MFSLTKQPNNSRYRKKTKSNEDWDQKNKCGLRSRVEQYYAGIYYDSIERELKCCAHTTRHLVCRRLGFHFGTLPFQVGSQG